MIIMTGESTQTTSKETMCVTSQLHNLSSEKWLGFKPCLIHCIAVRINNCSKNTSAIKVTSKKNTNNFCYKKKQSHATTKLTLFAVSNDEWDMKEELWHDKSTYWAEAASKSEKIGLIVLTIVDLCLPGGISQSVSQSISRKFC